MDPLIEGPPHFIETTLHFVISSQFTLGIGKWKAWYRTFNKRLKKDKQKNSITKNSHTTLGCPNELHTI